MKTIRLSVFIAILALIIRRSAGKRPGLTLLISDWDFTPTTQGRFFKAYLQGSAICR